MIQNKKPLIIGCAAFVLVGAAIVSGIVLFIAHISKEVEGVAIIINAPKDVVVGQTFDLEVNVKNNRPGKVLHLSDVDVAEKYLAGFSVSSVKPKPKSNMHIPFDNSRSFSFDVPISAGMSRSFIFTLRAEKPGLYRGDVDVCEGARFITDMAETVVKEQE